MNIAEHLESLRQSKKAAEKRMEDVAQKAIDEQRSMNQAEEQEFDELRKECDAIDRDVERYEHLLKHDKKKAQPVDDSRKKEKVASGRNFRTARDTQKLDKGMAFARYARVKALSYTGQTGARDEFQIAEKIYPGDDRLLSTIRKSAVSAANTGDDAWAGELITEGNVFADFIEYLRPRTLFGQVSGQLRSLPFDVPVLVQTSEGSAQWVKEGEAKPLTKWSYSRTRLSPLKVAAIAAATKETLERASVAADTFLRDELARAVGSRIDTTFAGDDSGVSGEEPAGILNDPTDPSLDSDDLCGVKKIRCDIAKFMTAMVEANQTLDGTFWIMPETVAVQLSLMGNEIGADAFPGIGPGGGTLRGIPVYTSQYLAATDPMVSLVKGSEIYLGDEGGLRVSVSDQASLEMDDSPSHDSTTPTGSNNLVSMWQTNSVAFLVERFLNWQKRRSEAVVAAQVEWDLCFDCGDDGDSGPA